jgi:hypothetical protein
VELEVSQHKRLYRLPPPARGSVAYGLWQINDRAYTPGVIAPNLSALGAALMRRQTAYYTALGALARALYGDHIRFPKLMADVAQEPWRGYG